MDLVGSDRAPANLSLVAGTGALLAMVGNPLFGQLSDRTTSRFGRRRPWLVVGLLGGSRGTLVVALAPNVAVVVAGWCIAQLFFNAMLAALVALLPDQVPSAQRGVVSGVLGVCLPVAAVSGTYLVKVFTGSLSPCSWRPASSPAWSCCSSSPGWTTRTNRASSGSRGPWADFARTFYVSPARHADFAWAFVSRFLFVTAYALLTTYQVFFLIDRVGTSDDDVPQRVFLATLVQSVLVIAASLVGGRLSDRTGRRKAVRPGGGGRVRRRRCSSSRW